MQIMIPLIEQEIQKRCKCVWFKVANETKSSPQQGLKMKCLGKLPGVSDYIFLKPDGNLCLEVKTENGKMSAHQKNFEQLCRERQIPFEVAYTYEEAIAILKKYGVLPE